MPTFRCQMTLPVHAVQRVNVVRFSCPYNCRPAARAIINVQRLRINIACDRSVEIEIPAADYRLRARLRRAGPEETRKFH